MFSPVSRNFLTGSAAYRDLRYDQQFKKQCEMSEQFQRNYEANLDTTQLNPMNEASRCHSARPNSVTFSTFQGEPIMPSGSKSFKK
jgi:hypothetical protein